MFNNVMILPQLSDVTNNRQKYIGGSDIPIILGISPFKTRYELLLEKSEINEKEFFGNKYTEYGHELEPKIREHIADQYGMEFIEYTAYNETFRYNDDGVSDDYVLEIKTTSQVKENIGEYKKYIVQLLLGMVLHEKPGILAIYERPQDMDEEFNEERLTLYHIEFQDYQDWIEEIHVEVKKFQEDLNRVNTTYVLEQKILQEQDFIPMDIVSLGNQLSLVEQELETIKALQNRQKKLKEALVTMMGEQGIKSWETPSGVKITYVEKQEDKIQEVIDTKSLKENHPRIYKRHMTLKTKKGSKAHVRVTLPKK